MKIEITEKSVYGNTAYYPVCATAKLLCAAAGTKQVTQHIIRCAVEAGYKVVVAGRDAKELF